MNERNNFSLNNYKSNWNDNISENHTMDIDYKTNSNKYENIPLKITKYKFNIINNKHNIIKLEENF